MIWQNVVDHKGRVVRQTVGVVGVKDYNVPQTILSLLSTGNKSAA